MGGASNVGPKKGLILIDIKFPLATPGVNKIPPGPPAVTKIPLGYTKCLISHLSKLCLNLFFNLFLMRLQGLTKNPPGAPGLKKIKARNF